jgi:hypothetical protein
MTQLVTTITEISSSSSSRPQLHKCSYITAMSLKCQNTPSCLVTNNIHSDMWMGLTRGPTNKHKQRVHTVTRIQPPLVFTLHHDVASFKAPPMALAHSTNTIQTVGSLHS